MSREFPNLLTAQEVADLLKVNKETVLRWARSGELPAYKIARHWRFIESDCIDYAFRRFDEEACQPLIEYTTADGYGFLMENGHRFKDAISWDDTMWERVAGVRRWSAKEARHFREIYSDPSPSSAI